MTEKKYTPPEIWAPDPNASGQWAKTNRPVSGATHNKDLTVGKHPIQLYSLATPNGQKVTIMLEELLALGKDAEYDAHIIRIGEGDQFSSGFVDVNPNSKIPAMVDHSVKTPIKLFESASILFYLAEKYDAFLPQSQPERAETMNWLFWLHGSAPYLGGGFGHFYHYAPEKLEYPINRFAMEAKRQLDVLNKHLAKNTYLAGESYTIADIATWPWYGNLVLGKLYNAATFLQVDTYKHVMRWAKQIAAREAVQRGIVVNKSWGEEWEQLPERFNASDIDAVLAKRPK